MARRPETNFHDCMRLKPQPRFSVISAGSLGSRILIMCKARRRGYWVEMLDTPEPLGRERRSDKEARSEFPLLNATQTSFTHLHGIRVAPGI